jgi:hypothetical protein
MSNAFPESLPTGQKIYFLDANEFDGPRFQQWSELRYEEFFRYMAVRTSTPWSSSAFSVLTPGSLFCHRPRISHELLKNDGFILGKMLKWDKDQEVVSSSRYAVFEVFLSSSNITTNQHPHSSMTSMTRALNVTHRAEVLFTTSRPACTRRIRCPFASEPPQCSALH